MMLRIIPKWTNEATEAERGQLNDPEIAQLVRDEAEIQT